VKRSIKKGFGFGLTSGVITTLGMMVGLNASTKSKLAVIGGIIAIAIADAFSDAAGIHIAEESENRHCAREIWEATLSTFFSKFLFALTFVVPVLVFELDAAIWVSIVWGLTLISYSVIHGHPARRDALQGRYGACGHCGAGDHHHQLRREMDSIPLLLRGM